MRCAGSRGRSSWATPSRSSVPWTLTSASPTASTPSAASTSPASAACSTLTRCAAVAWDKLGLDGKLLLQADDRENCILNTESADSQPQLLVDELDVAVDYFQLACDAAAPFRRSRLPALPFVERG